MVGNFTRIFLVNSKITKKILAPLPRILAFFVSTLNIPRTFLFFVEYSGLSSSKLEKSNRCPIFFNDSTQFSRYIESTNESKFRKSGPIHYIIIWYYKEHVFKKPHRKYSELVQTSICIKQIDIMTELWL